MIITTDLATYIGMVARAAADPDSEVPWTTVCPECEMVPEDIHATDHLLVDVVESISLGPDDPGHPAMRAVAIACEGYMVYDPSLFNLGAAFPSWMDWRDPSDAVEDWRNEG